MMLQRRQFLGGLIAMMAAPAVVRATSIMPVKTIVLRPDHGGFLIPPEYINFLESRVFSVGEIVRIECRVPMTPTDCRWVAV